MNAAAVAIVAAAMLLPHAALAQDGAGNATVGVAQEAAGAPDAWVILGIVLAATAVGGTIWNGSQLRRHVDLVKRDMDERLRPVLAWVSDGTRQGHSLTVLGGGMVRVRILNAGQVAAVGIAYAVRSGMGGDLEEAGTGRVWGQRGALAPNASMAIDVWLTDEQVRRTQRGEKFHFEVLLEYRSPAGAAYGYSMSGDYDGTQTVLRD